MKLTNHIKMFIVGLLATAMFVITIAGATAEPYDGINRVGTYYQYSSNFRTEPVYAYGGGYGYVAPPRAGGWFGSGTEWITGLRAPVWSNVPPVRYTTRYQQTCRWPCYTGGQGYPRMVDSGSVHYRMR